MQNLPQPRVIGIAGAIHVAPCGGAHVPALAGQPGPAALGRRDHAVEGAERVEHAVVAIEPPHRAVLGDIERDRSKVAGAVEHGDGDGFIVVGKRRGRERKPGVIVMVRHADQRHPLGKAELFSEYFRRAGHLVEPAAVESGSLRGAQQFCALRQFFQHRAGQRAGQRRIVPTGQPRIDIADIASPAAQRRHHGIDRLARIFCRVLVAREALFLVVDDQARAVCLCHLDQRHAGIVRAGRSEPGQIDGLATA